MEVSHLDPRAPDLVALLNARDGIGTLVDIQDGDTFTVSNIAWGYDLGDEYASRVPPTLRPAQNRPRRYGISLRARYEAASARPRACSRNRAKWSSEIARIGWSGSRGQKNSPAEVKAAKTLPDMPSARNR